jgi:hypothetical protein
MANLTPIYVLLAGSISLSACGGRVPSTASPAPITIVQVQPSAEPTIAPTPTPGPLDQIRERVYAVLGNPFEAESFRTETAKTTEEEATLLASVPEGGLGAVFNDYLHLFSIPKNLDAVTQSIQDRDSCTPGSYIAIDPISLAEGSAFKVWGEGVADLDSSLESAGLPNTSERHYVIDDCDDPQSRAAGVQEAEAMTAESERRIVSDEDVAEAALAAMVRGVIRDSFGVELPSQVEFSGATFSELRIFDSSRRLAAVEYFDIAEMGQDMASALWNVFDQDLRFEFERRYVGGFSLSPDPAVPVGVAIEGSTYSLPAAINAVAHQLIGPYPLGIGEGSDGRAISETFSIILERELTRRLVEAHYGDDWSRRDYAELLNHGFDGAGRHLSLPPTKRDPDGVYGSGPLAQAVFELRNCGLDRGQSIGEFFDMMKDVDTAGEVYSALETCGAGG